MFLKKLNTAPILKSPDSEIVSGPPFCRIYVDINKLKTPKKQDKAGKIEMNITVTNARKQKIVS